MINRELIRTKVIQLVYTNFKNEGKSLEDAVKELSFSLDKSYELYHYLLLLIPEITDYAREVYETNCERVKTLGGTNYPNARFVNNRFAAQMSENKILSNFSETHKTHRWTEDESIIRILYKQIIESPLYESYLNSNEDSYEADKNFWRHIYKNVLCNNENLSSLLEEWSIYWNDDKDIIDTFVIKTIKHCEEKNGADQPLLPAYQGEEDKEFAKSLFSSVLLHRSEYEDMIRQSAKNWKLDRMLIMDRVILVTAIAEMLNFPEIGKQVTFNEYLELAKVYSSPKSSAYINGVLDHVIKNNSNEHILNKKSL